ncbi:MAG: class I SAM-dependent methyltransferase [Candidatus Krumholzibacteriia bacterium]
MGIDHSATYRDRSLKNLVHRHRLRTILSVLRNEVDLEGRTYADVGCSNGYVTALVNDRFKPALACGYDHDRENLAAARASHPHLTFDTIDLNGASPVPRTYDVVTCFEVLEHVGSLRNALSTLLEMTAPAGGVLFLTVPIESGWRGAVKFLVKTALYRYRLDELPRQKHLYLEYVGRLVANRRMSRFRDRRHGWGTHFGFDYREIDDFLRSTGRSFEASNRGMSRFYLVRC